MKKTPCISYLINRRYADYRHGTGVQLGLIAHELGDNALHICWDSVRALQETYVPVLNLNTSLLRLWPFRKGKGLIARTESALGISWNSEDALARRTRRLRYARKSAGTAEQRQHAYVIVASEDEAKIARLILDNLDADYVLNVVDFTHCDRAVPDSYPQFSALIKGARKVFALTPTIAEVLESMSGGTNVCLLGNGRKRPTGRASAPSSADPLQIIMIGSLAYERGMQELKRFCDGLDTGHIQHEVNYIGPQQMLEHLPASLTVKYRGALSDEERDAVLSTMHLAYLPGPDGDPTTDNFAHYSFPSRLTDYFWHGIPILGPLYESSATARMLESLSGNGVWFSGESEDLVNVASRLGTDTDAWRQSSQTVFEFAWKHFDLEVTTEAIASAFVETGSANAE